MLFAQPAKWKSAAPLPVQRTEVAAALLRGKEIVVVGGFVASGANVQRADAYSPTRNRWRRIPSLPVAVDHAMAVSYEGRVYMLGGYGADRRPLERAFVFGGGGWRELRAMPEPRAAAGAAVAGKYMYVVGGIGPRGVATTALRFDLRKQRWTSIPGPSPREHLAATALRGKVYALAGRTATAGNFDTFEVYTPSRKRWQPLPRIPDTRGGTGAAAVGNVILSIGGEEPGGAIESVYRYQVEKRRWTRMHGRPAHAPSRAGSGRLPRARIRDRRRPAAGPLRERRERIHHCPPTELVVFVGLGQLVRDVLGQVLALDSLLVALLLELRLRVLAAFLFALFWIGHAPVLSRGHNSKTRAWRNWYPRQV
jgi:hypothetical protein